MTKKGYQKFSALKWKFLPKKGHFKTLVREIVSRPPKSAPSLRLWSWVLKVQQTEACSIGFRVSYSEFLFNIHNISTSNKSSLWKMFSSHIPVGPTVYDIIFHGDSTTHRTPKSRGRTQPTRLRALPQFTCRNSAFCWQTLSSPCKHLDSAAPCILGCWSFYLEFTSLADSIVTKELHAFALKLLKTDIFHFDWTGSASE